MSLDELVRLTRRTAALAQRLVRIAEHSAAVGEGLVITAELAVMEHQVETLADVVQLLALRASTDGRPHLAPKRPQSLRLSTEVDTGDVPIRRVAFGAARQ